MGMKGLKGKTIGLDTMIFIYHLEDHPKYSLVTEKLFESIEDSKLLDELLSFKYIFQWLARKHYPFFYYRFNQRHIFFTFNLIRSKTVEG